MRRLIKIIEMASKIGAIFATIFLILIVGLICTEIFLRTIFNKSTLIADEYSAYMYVFLVMLGLAYTFMENGHIKITLVTSRLNEKVRNIFEIVSLFFVLGILIFASYHSTNMVIETYKLDMRADTIAETPLYLPEIALPLGYLIFVMQVIVEIIKKIFPKVAR